eukprot:TRINITY_DN101171_c0_g1_i1.p1 TRINITY_DN101171_c0_g1~~TRINITY_DN101171_c0_g1_i1.p1  ORF type:complete len:106 (-),score=4.74 TRINITY_DN101171_c0_g1_i1:2-319(-)
MIVQINACLRKRAFCIANCFSLFFCLLQFYQPFQKFVYHRSVQRIVDKLPLLISFYQPCLLQQVQMMRYTGLRDIKLVCYLSCCQFFFFQQFQYIPSCLVIQRFE